MKPARALSVEGLAATQRARRLALVGVLVAASLAAGVGAGALAVSGHITAIALTLGLLFPVILWRRPAVGIAVFVGIATLIEQFPIPQFPLSGQPALIVTDQVPLFASLSGAQGISGVLVSPLEISLFAAVIVWIMKAALDRTLRLPRSPLALGMAGLLVVLAIAEVLGLAHGGSFRESVDELRPWFYLLLLYLVASQVLKGPDAVRPLLWAIVIGTGVKGLQGTVRFLMLRGAPLRPEAILGHEEAVFFGLFILLVVGLWMFGERGRLRTVGTALLPFVLVADLANTRRVAWLVLLAGGLALVAIGWIRLPARRRLIGSGAAVVAVAALLYLPLFWNGNGGLAQPARAVRSLISPSSRDNLSDLYRVQEDANLKFNIRRAGPLGAGFGVPIDYALPITDLLKTTPSLAYVPHNTILYLWMRLGIAGFAIFWFLIGAAILAASRLVRSSNNRLALFGALAVCAVFAYVLEGAYDLGLAWFRVAVYLGCLLGALEAMRPWARPVERVPDPAARIGRPS